MSHDQSIIDELISAEAALNPGNKKYNPSPDAYLAAYAVIRAAKIKAENSRTIYHQWTYGAGGAGPYYGSWDPRCGGPSSTVGGAG